MIIYIKGLNQKLPDQVQLDVSSPTNKQVDTVFTNEGKGHRGGEDGDQPAGHKASARALGGSLWGGGFVRLLPPLTAAGEKRQGLGTRLAAPGAQDRSSLSSDCPPPYPSSNPTSSPGIPPSLPGHCPCRNCQSPTVPGCWRVSFSACRATVRSSPRTSIPRDTSCTFRTRTETCNGRLA